MSLYKEIHPWQTRLIYLKSALDPAQVLEIELHTVDLLDLENGAVLNHDTVIEYDALSYAWGTDPPSVPCLCNGSRIMLRENLASALQYLRRPTTHRYLWADYICIDQSNTKEKELQIRRLMNIFSKASKIFAWLGCIPTMDSAMQACSRSCDDIFPPSIFGIPQCPGHFKNVVKLAMRSSWFQRAWVRQEVYAATELYVACPQFLVSWQSFSTTILGTSALSDRHKETKMEFSDEVFFPNVISLNQSFNQIGINLGSESLGYMHAYEAHMDLYVMRVLELLRDGTMFKATIPHDHIFSILGMVQRSKRSGPVIPVSYNKPYRELCGDIVRYTIRKTKNINILRLCSLQEDSTYMLDWSRVNWDGFELLRSMRGSLAPTDLGISQVLEADWFDRLNPIREQIPVSDPLPRPLFLYGRSWGVLSACGYADAKVYRLIDEENSQVMEHDLATSSTTQEAGNIYIEKGGSIQTKLFKNFYDRRGHLYEQEGVVRWQVDNARAGDVFVQLEPGPSNVVLRPCHDESGLFQIVSFAPFDMQIASTIRRRNFALPTSPKDYLAWAYRDGGWWEIKPGKPTGLRQVYAIR